MMPTALQRFNNHTMQGSRQQQHHKGNEDSEREQRRQKQVGHPRCAPIFFIFALYTNYTKMTEVREAARRVSTPLSFPFHLHCDAARRLDPPCRIIVAVALPISDNHRCQRQRGQRQQNKREEEWRYEEVGSSL